MKWLLVLLFACFTAGGRAEAERPNFLIILGDDISANSLGCAIRLSDALAWENHRW